MNYLETDQKVLVTDKVVKRFDGHTALDEVSIEVPQGGIFGLLGPNGAGKTTLLRIINQITAPDSGHVFLEGRPLAAEDVLRIGYLPEERGLYKRMKVGEQALYMAQLKGLSRAEAFASLQTWFTRFGITAWWNRKVNELSKGMAQKVQFIITVLHNPRLLILDEPFSGFDPVNVEVVRKEILRLRDEGVTIILSTHNMDSVEELCDNIALINKAKVVASGPVADVRRRFGDNRLELLCQGRVPEPEADLPFRVVDQVPQGELWRLEVDRGAATTNEVLAALLDKTQILGVKELIPRMHDVFIKLVKEA